MGRGSPMKRPPKYVQAFIDRNGKPRFYFRRPGFKSVPLPGLPWSPQIYGSLRICTVWAAVADWRK